RHGKWVFENDGGALEVACPPLKLGELGETEAVFQTFAELGLKPEVSIAGQDGGGGHIHLGRQIFDRNPLLLRNFIVDVLNNPGGQTVLEEGGEDQALSLRDGGLEGRLRAELAKLDAESASGVSLTVERVTHAVINAFGDGTATAVPSGDAIYQW